MRNKKRQKMSPQGFLESSFDLRVIGHDGLSMGANIWPTSLTPTSVTGIVEWHGINVISSFINATGDETEWGQTLLLIWAAVGPTSVRTVPILAIFAQAPKK